MKVLTLGSGFVADHLPYRQITERIPYDLVAIFKLIKDYQPDVLVNCIGKTGRPNVDWCESHKEETMSANVTLPLLLADACNRANVHLVQIGSGCIYFGESPNFHYVQGDGRPMPDVGPGDPVTITVPCKKIDDGWKETDFANPQSYYSKTKYSCDL